ncbi:hypothetical protein [Nocardia fusca]|uniref:hypothetical protein n=1 Tax=Nocardia fusca TaxID=941183 RepID=UPI0018DC36FB|nr:hypothetical protein [Nocardia fusca]
MVAGDPLLLSDWATATKTAAPMIQATAFAHIQSAASSDQCRRTHHWAVPSANAITNIPEATTGTWVKTGQVATFAP